MKTEQADLKELRKEIRRVEITVNHDIAAILRVLSQIRKSQRFFKACLWFYCGAALLITMLKLILFLIK